jgi:hypothetical protein
MAQDLSHDAAFESRLSDGTDRFISHMIEHAFAIGRRSSRDFLRHFPPSAIMEALKDSPSLRADIMETATGVRRKVALKKSALSSGEDLQIALDEGEAAAEEVVHLFRADDRVRYLPRGKLWAFLIEGDFWKTNKTDKGGYDRAQMHVAFLLDRALKDQVLSHQDIVEGISLSKICHLLPRPEIEMAMSLAVSSGRKGQPFSDRDLYDNLTSITLANYIPLTHIWDEVVFPCIAVEHGLSEALHTHPRNDKPAPAREPGNEEAKPVPANTNDQIAALAQSRLPMNRVGNAPTAVKRPMTATTPVGVAVKPGNAGAKPAVAVAMAAGGAPDEDAAFEVDFEHLTASKS